MDGLSAQMENLKELVIAYGTQFLSALLVLLVGLWIIKRITNNQIKIKTTQK